MQIAHFKTRLCSLIYVRVTTTFSHIPKEMGYSITNLGRVKRKCVHGIYADNEGPSRPVYAHNVIIALSARFQNHWIR